ncbi:MAG: Ketol-acid reductoisomerase (NADP(+)), partial [uncultured Thermomicrobiales bacterium]
GGDDLLRRRCGTRGARRQDRRGHRLRQPGARPRPQPPGLRGSRRGGAPRGQPQSRQGRGGRGAGRVRGRRRQDRRRDHGAGPRPPPEADLRRADRAAARAADRAGQDADVCPRLRRPLRPDHPAGARRRLDDRAEEPRAPGARAVPGGDRRPGAAGGGAGCQRDGQADGPRLRQGARLAARGDPRDDVQGRDRVGPLRRAGGPLRRRLGPGPGRLRDAGRGRVPARDRLLRVPPRAEADRRSDVRGRALVHALLGQRHRRVRRLHRRSEGGRRAHPGGDARAAGSDPGRVVRPRVDRRERGGPGQLPSDAGSGARLRARAGRAGTAGDDAVAALGTGRPGGAGRGDDPSRRRDRGGRRGSGWRV